MATVRQLYVELKARADSYNNSLRTARRETMEFERTIRPTMRTLDELGKVARTAGIAMTAAVTAPILAVAGLGLQFNAMQEQAQIAFTTMLGSGKKARDFLEEMKDFAAKTPFEFPDLVRASQRLLAMGFAAKEIKPLLTTVGDAAAGLGGGADVINRITLALGQMAGRGRVATQEMNQLTEVGIPAWRMLAEGMGISEKKLRDMVEKGLVPAGKSIEILQHGMDKAFGGMMAKQAETFSGLLSTIKDEARFIAGDLTTGFFNMVKGPLKQAVEMLERMRVIIAGLSDQAKSFLAIAAGGLAAIGPLLLGVHFGVVAIKSAMEGIVLLKTGVAAASLALTGTAMGLGEVALAIAGPAGIVVAIGAAVAALSYFALQNQQVRDLVTIAWYAMRQGIRITVEVLSTAMSALIDILKDVVSGFILVAKSVPGMSVLAAGLEAAVVALNSLNVHTLATMIRMKDLGEGIVDTGKATSDMNAAFKAVVPAIDDAAEAHKKHNKVLTETELRLRSIQALNSEIASMRIDADSSLRETVNRNAPAAEPRKLGAYYGKTVPAIANDKADIDFLSSLALEAFDASKAVDMLHSAMDRLNNAKRDTRAIDGPDGVFSQITERARAAMEAARLQASALNKAIAEMRMLGYSDAQMIALLGDELDTAARNAKALGTNVNASSQALIDQAAAAQRSQEEAKRWEATWSQVMANIVTDFARGMADVIFRAKSFAGAIANVGKTAGRAFIEAFFAELFNPLTNMLASWGRTLATKLTNILPKALGGIGKSSSFASGLGFVDYTGAGASGAGTAAGGAGGAGGGMFGISAAKVGAFFSNPITIGVGAALAAGLAVKHFVGRGRRAADDFGGQVERPFATQLADALAQFNSARSAGSLTRDEAVSTREQIASLIRTYNAQASEFAALGKAQAKVVEQAAAGKAANFGAGFQRVFDDINQTINQLTKAGTGSGIPGTGLALSASTKFADAVDRLVPALDKIGNVGSGAPATVVNNNYTISSDMNVTVTDSEDPRATLDRWRRAFRDNAEGLRAEIATGIKDTLNGVVVSTS